MFKNGFWLKAVGPLLQLRSHEADSDGRVQFAFGQTYVAASESPASSGVWCDMPAANPG